VVLLVADEAEEEEAVVSVVVEESPGAVRDDATAVVTGGEDTGMGDGAVGVDTVLLLALLEGIVAEATSEGDATGASGSSVVVSMATGPSASVMTEDGENSGVEVLEGGGMSGAGELRTGAGELMAELEEGVDAVGKAAVEVEVVEEDEEEEEEEEEEAVEVEEGAGMIGDED